MVRRSDAWILSRGAIIAVAVAVAAVVAIVLAGVHEQSRRQMPAPRSVSIWSAATSPTEVGPVVFGVSHARSLAAIVNQLGRMPSGTYNCGADIGRHYRLVFETSSGTVQVVDDLGGCLGVSIASNGEDWGSGKWDPSGRLSGATRADLADTDRH